MMTELDLTMQYQKKRCKSKRRGDTGSIEPTSRKGTPPYIHSHSHAHSRDSFGYKHAARNQVFMARPASCSAFSVHVSPKISEVAAVLCNRARTGQNR
jgi:hypothetical protein